MYDRFMWKFIIRVLGGSVSLALSKGILLWLSWKGIHTDQWVATMLGATESSSFITSGAAAWLIPGILGLLGLMFAPQVVSFSQNLRRRFMSSKNENDLGIGKLLKGHGVPPGTNGIVVIGGQKNTFSDFKIRNVDNPVVLNDTSENKLEKFDIDDSRRPKDK